MVAGGDSGPAIAPRDAPQSLLLQRVSATDPADRMPPEHEGEPLSKNQITVIRTWIAVGAPAPADEIPEVDPKKHWAFQPVLRPNVASDWARNPIDAFVKHDSRQPCSKETQYDELLISPCSRRQDSVFADAISCWSRCGSQTTQPNIRFIGSPSPATGTGRPSGILSCIFVSMPKAW